jgi:hypothetical protein
MKNKNFRKLKYVSGNPQNAGFCTIFTLQLLGALAAHRPPAKIFQPHFLCRSPPTFESVESPVINGYIKLKFMFAINHFLLGR